VVVFPHAAKLHQCKPNVARWMSRSSLQGGKIWIIEGPNPNEDQMWSCLSLAKDRSTAIWAKPAVHSIAAVRHAREVARLPYDLERRGAKASTNRSAARAQVLAIAAPAHPRSDRRSALSQRTAPQRHRPVTVIARSGVTFEEMLLRRSYSGIAA
jgi:hypothetical protein